tara:strand:- start:584 stop:859 length:276 start_codon:yes stop_codon:yes gene_type:complete
MREIKIRVDDELLDEMEEAAAAHGDPPMAKVVMDALERLYLPQRILDDGGPMYRPGAPRGRSFEAEVGGPISVDYADKDPSLGPLDANGDN